eukprot:21467-Heterococcus_DN1.PRE.4
MALQLLLQTLLSLTSASIVLQAYYRCHCRCRCHCYYYLCSSDPPAAVLPLNSMTGAAAAAAAAAATTTSCYCYNCFFLAAVLIVRSLPSSCVRIVRNSCGSDMTAVFDAIPIVTAPA